jgi:acyl-CoA thioester hydrolase
VDATPFHVTVPIEVRFSDLDALGHVNNATYFTYFEIARIGYLRTVSGRRVVLGDIALVIVDAACHFISPALLDEILHVDVRVSHMRRSSFAFEYRIRDSIDDRLIVEGRTVQTAFDHRSGKMIGISAAFREHVERFEGRTFNPREPIPPWGR